MSKITVEVSFTEKEFREVIEYAGLVVTDKAEFKKVFASKAFARALAADLKQCWESANEDSGDMDCLLEGMFEGCVTVEDEFNYSSTSFS